MTIICGIDPGLSGALAFYDTATGQVETIDMPTLSLPRGGKARREVDPHALADLFWKRHCRLAVLEQSWPRPNDSAQGGFKVGDGYGAIRGVLAAVGVPYTVVSPQKWKRSIGVTGDKDEARSRASQLLPQAADQWRLKKHDGRAEAALLALYSVREFSTIAAALPAREDAESVSVAAIARAATEAL